MTVVAQQSGGHIIDPVVDCHCLSWSSISQCSRLGGAGGSTSLSGLPVDECRRPVPGCTLPRTLAVEQTVEPREERLVVGERSLVMHVVLDGAAPARQPAVQRQRQVVADVRLDRQRNAQQHERPLRQWMRTEAPR